MTGGICNSLRRHVVIGLVIGTLATVSVASAATLGVTSARITTSSAAASVAPTTCTLAPSADAPLARDFGGNLGAYEFMSVRSLNNAQRRSIVRFDIASCGIPSNAAIRTSELRLSVVTTPGSNRTYTAHRVTGNWSENTVTYANQPAFISAATASVSTGAAPSVLSWSVLSDVTAFVRGTATLNGWTIKDTVENAGSAVETAFGTRESSAAGDRPVLVIGYYP